MSQEQAKRDPVVQSKAGGIKPVRTGVILALACLAQFMVVLDISVVNVALPSIRASLGFSVVGLQWVVNAYTLTFAGFLLLGGRAADLYGRRRLFLVGTALFTLASLVGGLSHGQLMLTGARVVQGLGAAILAPVSLTLITTTFTDGRARVKAIGLWSASAAGGGAFGVLLGGVLTNYLGWRWIFFINIPIGILGVLAGRLFIFESRADQRTGGLDVLGALMVTLGLTIGVYGIVRSTVVGWTSLETVSSFVLAALFLVGFVLYEARIPKAPLVPLALFKIRSVYSANIVMMCLGGAMFSYWYFASLYMQEVLGYSPLKTGLAFFPQTLGIIAGAQISSRTLHRFGPKLIATIGISLSATGLGVLSTVSEHSSYLNVLFVPSVLAAFGMGLTFTPLSVAANSGVGAHLAGLASGVVNTSRQIGGSIGLAALATVATAVSSSALTHSSSLLSSGSTFSSAAVATALTAGFSRAFLLASGVAVLGAIAAVTLLPGRVKKVL